MIVVSFLPKHTLVSFICDTFQIVGILLKTAAVVIYIVVFPFKDEEKPSPIPVRLQARADLTLNQYRMLFFVVLIALEVFVLLVGICLKWHLVAFEKIESSAQKRYTMTLPRASLQMISSEGDIDVTPHKTKRMVTVK
ncbi:unnamed protein product [Heligmosomoides polygyrus]|uniref:Uncharacterized protein n=1 Tax=Heligmosomoides polygyrus TaxID=6339 RepID=A0A3P8E1F4_HELPZ|nr:unnamed protein product [Heligmosomoides polygyrus]